MELLLFLAATLRISVPYTLAAMGASFSERGGVINIGLEGMMLNGALAYVLGAYWTGDPWLGLAAAVLVGVLTAALHALVVVGFRADQITSGLGINLLAAGLTKFVLTAVFHSSSNSSRVVGLPEWSLFGLERELAQCRYRHGLRYEDRRHDRHDFHGRSPTAARRLPGWAKALCRERNRRGQRHRVTGGHPPGEHPARRLRVWARPLPRRRAVVCDQPADGQRLHH